MTGTLITRRTILPFEHMGEFYQAVAMVPFAVQGIGVWGATLEDTIEQMQVGNTAIAAGGGWFPAMFYAMPEGQGYPEFARRVEAGEALPQTWGPEYFMSPNTMFRLRAKRNGQTIAGLVIAVWGVQLVAFSDEPIKTFPDTSYWDFLEKERGFLQTRLAEIDETLANVGARPTKPSDPPEAPAELTEETKRDREMSGERGSRA